MKLTYTLTIEAPDEIDADTRREIDADADPRDVTFASRTARWLGGYVSEAEERLSSELGDGWRVWIGNPR